MRQLKADKPPRNVLLPLEKIKILPPALHIKRPEEVSSLNTQALRDLFIAYTVLQSFILCLYVCYQAVNCPKSTSVE